MTFTELCRKKIDAATPAKNWYQHFHRGGDCYGPEDSLRGPYFSWIKFTGNAHAPLGALADTKDDAEFIAFARTALPEAVRRLELAAKHFREIEDWLNSDSDPGDVTAYADELEQPLDGGLE